MFNTEENIVSGTLANISKTGIYVVHPSSTYDDAPVSHPEGMLICFIGGYGSGSMPKLQIFQNNDNSLYYRRSFGGSSYSSWFKITATSI